MEIDKEQIFQNINDKQYEYLTAFYLLKGYGKTGEFDDLIINGKTVKDKGKKGDTQTWGDRETELYKKLGYAGWKMIKRETVVVGASYYHYVTFIREIQ